MAGKKRLNGWQRLGIIATVLWALYAVWDQLSNISQRQSLAYGVTYDSCTDANRGGGGTRNCSSEAFSALGAAGAGQADLWIFTFWALTPILFGWLATYAMIGVVRWVVRGFARE